MTYIYYQNNLLDVTFSLTLKEENVKKRLPSWVPRIEKKEKNIRFLLRERMRLLFCLLRVKLKLMSLKRKKIH